MTAARSVVALRHVPHESLGALAGEFSAAGVPIHYFDLFEPRWQSPELSQAAGLVVLGGPMNVDETDRFPFLAAEVTWIRAALAAELPILGICLGSQLLAKAADARVYANGVKEIGWYPLTLTKAAADDPLFAEVVTDNGGVTVFQWHGDTFDLPAGAVHLATSAACRHQAFRLGKNAWGLQFHIEVDATMVESWLCEPQNCGELSTLPYIDAAAIRAQTPRWMPGLEQVAGRVLGRFARICRERIT